MGVSGNTLYDQFLIYSSLLYSLKPEIVISFFYGVEICNSFFYCEFLLKEHDIFYNIQLERLHKKMLESDLPLRYATFRDEEMDTMDTMESQKNIIKSLQIRVKQFYDMVISNKGSFYPIITPLLHCKKHWSKKESVGYIEYFEQIGKFYSFNRDRDVELLEFFKKGMFVKIYDANLCIKDSKETLFNDWIHPNKQGNRLIAKFIVDILKSDEMLRI